MGRARYGVDAPGALIGQISGGLAGSLVAAGLLAAGWWIGWIVLAGGLFGFASAAVYLHTTLRGKFAVWARELRRLELDGGERALDLGCGRGMVLIQVAKLLPRGRAVGIDLWRGKDQSGNTGEVARRNAEAEGVSGRVDLVTGDMRSLPFEDGSFDLVVSSLAVHNVPDAEGRARAVAEAYRVLAPGGRLLLADFQHVRDYAAELRALSGTEPAVRGLGWRFWYGGPWFGTRMATLRKPG
ncbi:class I SAM-dependent methyltransferase [Actinomadura sp.]|jgi:ubiquinone/menaquinone biosynthesis C-methylase UbiE|uniref:class I SAM-dependent methyltransferase n=1 Tax=Actinomadura sp. TaxID=1989 RepID=UPI003362BE60